MENSDSLKDTLVKLKESAKKLNAIAGNRKQEIRSLESFLASSHVGVEVFDGDIGYAREAKGWRIVAKVEGYEVRPLTDCNRDLLLSLAQKVPALLVKINEILNAAIDQHGAKS